MFQQESYIEDFFIGQDLPSGLKGEDNDFTRMIVAGMVIALVGKLLFTELVPGLFDIIGIAALTYIFIIILDRTMDSFIKRVRKDQLAGLFLFMVPLILLLIVL